MQSRLCATPRSLQESAPVVCCMVSWRSQLKIQSWKVLPPAVPKKFRGPGGTLQASTVCH